MSLTVTERWAQFARARFTAESTHDETVSRALLDFCGVAIAGSREPVARAVAGVVADQGGRQDARLLAGGAPAPVAEAARANAVAGHALELDDGHRLAAGHPGVVVFPAALAVAEWRDRPGVELLRAARLGYEWFVRLGATLNPAHLRRGFHTTCTAGVQAAALTAGLLMGLDDDALAAALGLAGLRAAGLLQVLHEGSAAKPVQVGASVADGVGAAVLAQTGISGPHMILEGEDNMLRALDASHDASVMLEDLGTAWWSDDIYVKRHSACRHTHAALDIAGELHVEAALDADEIDSVAVETYATAVHLCGNASPRSAAEARFSLPFSVSHGLLHGHVPASAFDPESLEDPRTRALAERVTVAVADDLEALYPAQRGARLRVVSRRYGRLERTQIGAVGDPERPLTLEQLRMKLADLLGAAAAEQLADTVARASAAASCRSLVGELVAIGHS